MTSIYSLFAEFFVDAAVLALFLSGVSAGIGVLVKAIGGGFVKGV